MDSKIIKFIRKHHVLTLATSRDNIPWTAHCFYAFMEDEKALVFTTDDDTRHGQEMLENPVVSGGIALETKVVGMIRGVQLTGRVHRLGDDNTPGDPRLRGDDENDELSQKSSSSRTESSGDPGPHDNHGSARHSYLKRFPYAALMKTSLWILELERVKFTDNRLGFGNKLHWERTSNQSEPR